MKKNFIVFLCIIIISSLPASNLFSQESPAVVVLSGLPIKKDMSDIEGTEQLELSKGQQWNYRVEIIKKGNGYYWASRENKKLLYSKSGEFHNFIEPNGAGYIRVVKTEKGILYMEHLTLGFKNITYWGIASESSLR